MQPTFYRPHGSLARHVEYFWTFEWGERDTVRTLRMFATGVSGILLQHHEGRPALGSRASGLNDGSAGLGNFSKEHLGEELLNARSDHERVARLSAFLRARVDGAGAEDLLVTECLGLIRTDIQSIRVPQLLKRLKVSERQLERRFVRAIGVSPHRYIRILRFRKAVQLMKANQFERLSDVAYDLNYVDQSHFVKDIKAFSGFTPSRLVQTVRAGVDLPCALITREH
jgi:AraC-like DNA-binding protein